DIQTVFNYAMAEWALAGSPPKDLMKHVLEIAKISDVYKSANFYQCIALASAICDEEHAARQSLRLARAKLRRPLQPTEFSCWRYQEAPVQEFRKDLDDLERFINGENVQPLFFRRKSKTGIAAGAAAQRG